MFSNKKCDFISLKINGAVMTCNKTVMIGDRFPSVSNAPEDNYSQEACQHKHCINVGIGDHLTNGSDTKPLDLEMKGTRDEVWLEGGCKILSTHLTQPPTFSCDMQQVQQVWTNFGFAQQQIAS